MIHSSKDSINSAEPDTYLVTGCCGFIGVSFCLSVLKSGKTVIGVDNFTDFYPLALKLQNLAELEQFPQFSLLRLDLSDPVAAKSISQLNFDCIVHLAAQPGVRESIDDPDTYYKNNIMGTYNLMNALFFSSSKKLVFASSSSIYSDLNYAPFIETEDELLPPSPYGMTKLVGERMLEMARSMRIDTMALRFFSVYGPRQRPDLLIPKVFQAGIDGTSIPIFGDGSSSRDFTYVGDIVQSIRLSASHLMKHHSVFEILNVGSDKPVSVNEIIAICERIMHKKVHRIELPANNYENKVTWADCQKIKNLLGFQPNYYLEMGLTDHWEWFEATHKMNLKSTDSRS